MNLSSYTFDGGWERERDRLVGIERLWDPGTKEVLDRVGVGPGWKCLEIGGGAGSITDWLCERAGNNGEVIATDLDTRFLDWIERPNLSVRRHDIRSPTPPATDFDLVHARLLVEHVGAEAIANMVAALRPGGVLVLEDYDLILPRITFPPNDAFEKSGEATIAFMQSKGFDPAMGRKLVSELRRAGLESVCATGRLAVIQGCSPETAFHRLTLEALHDALVESGTITDEEISASLRLLDDPDTTILTQALIAAWGFRSQA